MSAIKAPASSHFSWHHDLNNTYQVHGSCVGGCTFLHERLIDDSIHSEPNPQRGLTLNTQIDQRAHPCSRHTHISTIVLSVLTFVRHHHQKFPCEWITLAWLSFSILSKNIVAVWDKPALLLHAVLFTQCQQLQLLQCNGEACKQV